MSSENFTNFLNLHQELNELTSSQSTSWDAHLFLPPCTCNSSDSKQCSQAATTEPFDFSTFDSIEISSLTDVIKVTKASHNMKTVLCKKYSLTKSKRNIAPNAKTKDKVSIIKSSEEYSSKVQLIKSDFKLLFPLCGSNFIFKARKSPTSIKFSILCSQKRLYEESKQKASTPCNKTRKTTTTKATAKESCCPFFINLYLDLISFDWVIQLNDPTLQHCNHRPIKFEGFTIGKHQLSTSMLEEINRLQSCYISSSIQQRILLKNNNIAVPVRTLLNNQYSNISKDLANMTDAEKLLDYLTS